MPISRNRRSRRRRTILLAVIIVGALLLIYTTLCFLAPSDTRHSQNHQYTGTEVIAHRGGSGLWPENTLLAFQRATDLGVDALEMDVRTTADGVLVLLHDETVDRTTNGAGPLNRYTIDTLKQLDAGYNWTADKGETYAFRGQGITIPTLEEIFAALPKTKMTIEIKEADFAGIDTFCSTIRRHDMTHQVTVASVHVGVLQRFRSVCPEVTSAAAFPEVLSFFLLDRIGLAHLYSAPAEILAIPQSWSMPPVLFDIPVADRRFITSSHKQGKHVRVWTVNEVTEMQDFLDLQVDGIITDYPDMLLDEIEKRR